MQFDPPLLRGQLQRRYKRFLADVTLEDGREITAHCPNPGAMTGCAEPGWAAALSYHPEPRRKLPYTLEMTHNGQSWIGVNTHRANPIVAEALAAQKIPELQAYPDWQREVRYGEKSRVDFLLSGPVGQCYLEVKSVTLRQGPNLLFPDAVTTRGKKHIEELLKMKAAGHRAVLLFVVQRQDGAHFCPAAEIDPAYAEALRQGVDAGLEVLVYQSQLNPQTWELAQTLPWSLNCP